MSSLHGVLNCLSFLHLYLLFYGRGLGTVMQADYINFVLKFRNFRYRGDLDIFRTWKMRSPFPQSKDAGKV